MKNKLLIPVFCLLATSSLFSQTLMGRVTSTTGVPIEFAEVSTTSGRTSTTGEEGYFSILTSGFPIQLRISAPGYLTKSLNLTQLPSSLIIHMEASFEQLSTVELRSLPIRQSLLNTPSSIGVLTEEELQGRVSLVEALERIPGLTSQQAALNTNKISIRGIGARSQYSTNRLKAYFMGIPITSGEGETTIDDLDPSVVGRVEVIKGPVSSSFGAGLGGVVQLYPRQPEKGVHLKLEHQVGTYGLSSTSYSSSFSSGKNYFIGNLSKVHSDGFRENDAYDRQAFNGHGRISTGKGELSLLTQLIKVKAFIPSSLSYADYIDHPEKAAESWGAAKGYESYDKGLIGLSYTHDFGKTIEWRATSFLSFRDAYEPRPFDILSENQISTGARTHLNWKGSFWGRRTEMSLGSEFRREWYEMVLFENLFQTSEEAGSIRGKNVGHNEQVRDNFNVFYQINTALSNHWIIETGINLNVTQYQLTDLFAEDTKDQTGSYNFPTTFSPRMGAVYQLTRDKNFYASISHGFSTPSVAETLTPEGNINLDLKPETGLNYEIGFKGGFANNSLYFEAAAFYIDIENLLVAERVEEDRYIGRNAGRTRHAGLEFQLSYQSILTEKVDVEASVNASIYDFRFEEFKDKGSSYNGNVIPAVPQKSLHFNLRLGKERWSLLSRYEYQGRMALNDANSIFSSAYQLLDLDVLYERNIVHNLRLIFSAGLKNVFDEHYAASIVPNAVGFNGAPRYYYPGLPRNWRIGISVGYEF